jgi:hypothetical protein
LWLLQQETIINRMRGETIRPGAMGSLVLEQQLVRKRWQVTRTRVLIYLPLVAN